MAVRRARIYLGNFGPIEINLTTDVPTTDVSVGVKQNISVAVRDVLAKLSHLQLIRQDEMPDIHVRLEIGGQLKSWKDLDVMLVDDHLNSWIPIFNKELLTGIFFKLI